MRVLPHIGKFSIFFLPDAIVLAVSKADGPYPATVPAEIIKS
jgi:hypothetical protein